MQPVNTKELAYLDIEDFRIFLRAGYEEESPVKVLAFLYTPPASLESLKERLLASDWTILKSTEVPEGGRVLVEVCGQICKMRALSIDVDLSELASFAESIPDAELGGWSLDRVTA